LAAKDLANQAQAVDTSSKLRSGMITRHAIGVEAMPFKSSKSGEVPATTPQAAREGGMGSLVRKDRKEMKKPVRSALPPRSPAVRPNYVWYIAAGAVTLFLMMSVVYILSDKDDSKAAAENSDIKKDDMEKKAAAAPEFTMLYEDTHIAVCVSSAAVCVLVLVLFLGILWQKAENRNQKANDLQRSTSEDTSKAAAEAKAAAKAKAKAEAAAKAASDKVAVDNVRVAAEAKVKAEKTKAPEKGTREGRKDNCRTPFPAFSQAGCPLFARSAGSARPGTGIYCSPRCLTKEAGFSGKVMRTVFFLLETEKERRMNAAIQIQALVRGVASRKTGKALKASHAKKRSWFC